MELNIVGGGTLSVADSVFARDYAEEIGRASCRERVCSTV